jgi:hypothetical protein
MSPIAASLPSHHSLHCSSLFVSGYLLLLQFLPLFSHQATHPVHHFATLAPTSFSPPPPAPNDPLPCLVVKIESDLYCSQGRLSLGDTLMRAGLGKS